MTLKVNVMSPQIACRKGNADLYATENISLIKA